MMEPISHTISHQAQALRHSAAAEQPHTCIGQLQTAPRLPPGKRSLSGALREDDQQQQPDGSATGPGGDAGGPGERDRQRSEGLAAQIPASASAEP